MHTTEITDDQGRCWRISHNGDWSGDVTVARFDPPETTRVVEEYTLPGVLFRQACAQAVARDVISMLEQWDGSCDAALRAANALARRK